MDTKKWKWFRIGDYFQKPYKAKAYNAQDLVSCCSKDANAVAYITRSDLNNGCSTFVLNENFNNIELGNAITIGDTTATIFYQERFFICGDHMVVLRSEHLNRYVGLFVTTLLCKERFRYNYGRAFNKDIIENTLLKLPAIKKAEKYEPDWAWMEQYAKNVEKTILPTRSKDVWQNKFNPKPASAKKLQLNTNQWQWFRYDEIFEICKGFYNKKPEENPIGDIPFIGATDSNNGITSMHDLDTINNASKTGDEPNAPLEQKVFKPNCITVSNNGSVGYAFYQTKKFTCTHDVNPLYIHKKWHRDLNIYIAMFLCSLIEKERFRWDYGRKWRPKRMPDSLIKLPVRKITPNEYEPDWQFMEDYIKSLPYSSSL